MATEIERKYLVTDERWRTLPLLGVFDLDQGYLPTGAAIRMKFSSAAYGFTFLKGDKKIARFAVERNGDNRDFETIRDHPAFDTKKNIFTVGKGAMARIRATRDDQGVEKSYLTIKRCNGDCEAKDEYELEIPYAQGSVIMKGLCKDFVTKSRHLVEHEGRVWEVDVFGGELSGLVVAEIEVADREEFDSLATLPGADENVTAHRGMGNHNLGRDGIPPDIAGKLSF